MKPQGEAQIVWEGHLNLQIKRHRENAALSLQLATFSREVDQPLPVAASVAGGDRERLRGIPVCGNGGAIDGTRPDHDALIHVGKLWTLASLSRDIDGTSPGTQPEEALLAKCA